MLDSIEQFKDGIFVRDLPDGGQTMVLVNSQGEVRARGTRKWRYEMGDWKELKWVDCWMGVDSPEPEPNEWQGMRKVAASEYKNAPMYMVELYEPVFKYSHDEKEEERPFFDYKP